MLGEVCKCNLTSSYFRQLFASVPITMVVLKVFKLLGLQSV